MADVVLAIPTLDSPANGGEHGAIGYGVVWIQSLIKELENQNIPYTKMKGDEVIRENVERVLREENPKAFFSFGHGLPDVKFGQFHNGRYVPNIGIPQENTFTLYGEKITLSPINNPEIMKDRVCYLFSCLTAQKLGKVITEKGAKGYAGYEEEFIWLVEDPENPAQDELAAPFGEAGVEFPIQIVQGKTVKEAEQATIQKFNELITTWENNNHPKSSEMVKWLMFNRDNFRTYGEGEVVLEEEPKPREITAGITPTQAVLTAGAIGGISLIYYLYNKVKGD